RWVFQRHEHLALAQLPEPHVVLHDRVAARVAVLIAQPLRRSAWRCGVASCLPPCRLPGSGRSSPPKHPAWAAVLPAAAGIPVAPSTAASYAPPHARSSCRRPPLAAPARMTPPCTPLRCSTNTLGMSVGTSFPAV